MSWKNWWRPSICRQDPPSASSTSLDGETRTLRSFDCELPDPDADSQLEEKAENAAVRDFDVKRAELLGIRRRRMLHRTEPQSTSDTFPHVCQGESWDCGIACIEMVYLWCCQSCRVDAFPLSAVRDWMVRFASTQSIWTVDLVILLQGLKDKLQLPINLLFCSDTLRVNTALAALDYYQSTFDKDRKRVQHRLQAVSKMNIPVHQGELRVDDLVAILSDDNAVAIVLVNNAMLMDQDVPGQLGRESCYTGHYLVLSGVSSKPQHVTACHDAWRENSPSWCFIAHNPASDEKVTFLNPVTLELAWDSIGTDHDIIFIVK
ncbi:predicted protein [Phaeodactylum tricornutum CCAP 1055/1]|jgi:hypothetical protein|uniref:Guanylyl cyclase n=1 Tax=Phaeodactylum tricornutum (strain CCAP 1055/1) TaxID=556484 RepID=B7FZI8_PHATC|nr:predicted protein [Phaeodactylum tricornutum CCAP 1055/1]EEC48346.1 predicted protein [Phaeodactylum tricornutum CCAP 1055/1]|eukprot:XP_002180155.1 predicted protein [Phaeodactylum tricornutum CCAP 1055/1]